LVSGIIELSESHGYYGGQDMKRTWMPKAAGILCIIIGIIYLIPVMAVWAIIFSDMFYHHVILRPDPLILILILLLVFGIMPIVGGIYALRRRRWKLALAGSICCPLSALTLLGFYFLIVGNLAYPDTPESSITIPMILGFIVVFVIFGILPYVFVVLGKGEFKGEALVAYKRHDDYDEMGGYDKVITSYSEDIETNPNKAYAYYTRGDFFYKTDEYDLAIPDYSKAIQFNPNYGRAYYGRGLAYREKGEVTRAVNDLEKCIGLSTDTELTKAAQQALSEIKNSL
jgi:hypothetical protein